MVSGMEAKRRPSDSRFLRSSQLLAEIAPARYDGEGGQLTASAQARRMEPGLGFAGPSDGAGALRIPLREAPPSIVDSLHPLDLPPMPDLRLAIHPHPILRYRAKSIARVDKELKGLIAQMFELMYHHQGVGLAASQVELPLRIFVCNPTGHRDEGPELVFINPVLSKPRGIEEQEEGCLSLPGIRAQVKRSKSIWVNGYNAVGQEINQEFSGFLARIIQHETDHLDGVLFLDRLLPERRKDLDTAVETLMEDHLSRQRTGSTPDDSQLMARVPEWEQRYC